MNFLSIVIQLTVFLDLPTKDHENKDQTTEVVTILNDILDGVDAALSRFKGRTTPYFKNISCIVSNEVVCIFPNPDLTAEQEVERDGEVAAVLDSILDRVESASSKSEERVDFPTF